MTQLFSPLSVKQNTVTHSGTDNFPMAPAILEGFNRFGDSVSDNDEFLYYAKSATTNEWEIAKGRFDATGDGIVERLNPVYAGTNGTNKVFFTSGVIEVSLVSPHWVSNLVATGLAATLVSSELPKVTTASTVAIGKRADATIGDRGVSVGEDSASGGNDSVAIGSGAQADVNEVVILGKNASGLFTGSMGPFYASGLGIKSTPYSRGMTTFTGGGSVSTDLARLYIQTTNATPDLMELDLDGGPAADHLVPVDDGRDKSAVFEVHLLARNATDNEGKYIVFRLVGIWNGVNFVQIGSTDQQLVAESAGMSAASATVTIANDRLEINVTGISAKTIQWAATAFINTLWHAGVPGSGAIA